jgi:integrase
MAKLTQSLIDRLRPTHKTHIADDLVQGLAVALAAPKSVVYVFRFRRRDGAYRKILIGDARTLRLRDARKIALDYRHQIICGEEPDPLTNSPFEEMIYRDFVEQRFLPYVRQNHRGWKAESSYLQRHLVPAFGDLLVSDIDAKKVSEWLRVQKAGPLKPGAINRALNILKSSLSRAVEWEATRLEANPIRIVRPLPDHARRQRYLTPEEGERLLDVVRASDNPLLYPIIGLLLLTGARKSEALGLEWRHIDPQTDVWTVPLSKSGKPRDIPLTQASKAMLETARRTVAQTPLRQSRFVFPNVKTGARLRDISHAWLTARKRAGLEDVRLHDLRHSFASALVNSGCSIYDVQKLLGHADVRTTQRYAHLSVATLRASADHATRFYATPPRKDYRL